MKNLLLPLMLALYLGSNAQSLEKFNLDFEKKGSTTALSQGWIKWGSYEVGTDEITVFSGGTSGWIDSGENEGSFGSIAYSLPAAYKGKEITLEGYMKTESVTNGYAGLLLRIDGNRTALEFDNMQSQKIDGSRDWTKYSITLPFPEKAEKIYIGGLLTGSGKAWFDSFKLSIDGKDVQTLKTVEAPVFKAHLDKEFDTGSRIHFKEINASKINDLALLGKVWGFLKYHHPQIAAGNCNWDYELFRILPEYLETQNAAERDQLLVNWIDALGEIPQCQNCNETSKMIYLRPDHSWMNGEGISSSLEEKLQDVYQNRNQEEHFYIGFAPGVGNPEFKNEQAYADMSFPDDGFRLLALYRYWNMIHYFFPNRHLTEKNWNEVLAEYIPGFINAENELQYELVALQLIGEIHDTHANLWGGGDKVDEWKGRNYAPLRAEFVEDKLVVTDYYNPELKKTNWPEIGDVITHIDDRKVEAIVENLETYYPASNQPARLRNMAGDLLRSPLRELDIRFVSKTGAQQETIRLYERDSLNMYGWYKKEDEKSYRLLEDNIGYVTLGSIKESDLSEIKKEFNDTDGIIIDIRNYPSTFVVFSLGSWFTSSEVPFVRFSKGSYKNPGEFTLTNPLSLPASNATYQGKLLVLVNEETQSSAEYTAMAFRAGDNTTVIGSTTSGADGNVSSIMLPGGLRTMISGIGVYYPDGRETQRVGIIPDIEIKPTIEGVRNGKDEVLEKAVEIIKEKN
ncbi:S41 family peptidase [Salinimicrobium sp. GXAS 041]|uniref:S41 family peptidase n=1 Tax=Salinimicrobium sp. GXAS 041 TaxID=3400806 RepID=UPI003C79118C